MEWTCLMLTAGRRMIALTSLHRPVKAYLGHTPLSLGLVHPRGPDDILVVMAQHSIKLDYWSAGLDVEKLGVTSTL